MITMDLYNYIRFSYFQLGKPIREISRTSKVSRQTIRKAIGGQEPGYELKRPRTRPVMGCYEGIVRSWLEKDKKIPKKQRHTARRIFDRLHKEYDFQGSYSAVKELVRDLKVDLGLANKEGFIPSDPEKRHGAEVDWGEVYVDLGEVRTKVYMFCMRAKFSGKIFVKLYPRMLQECFFDGHISAFAYFGGVFGQVIYDNLKIAVKKVLKGRDRIEQKDFRFFRSYYCFQSEFCNCAKGSEKGGVEGLVGFARRNFLTPIPQCDSLEKINAVLLEQCMTRDLSRTAGQSQSIGELFEQERSALIALPRRPYNNYKLIDASVDKFLTVMLQHNRYSVPEHYVGQSVVVELGLFDVRITCKDKLIATHTRAFGKHKWVLDPWHYMELLRRKSRAFPESRILSVIERDWDPVIKRLWSVQCEKLGRHEGTKDFLESVLFFQEKPYADMITVFELAIENNTTNSASVAMLYETLIEDAPAVEEVCTSHLEPIADLVLPAPDVDKFDRLMEGTNDG